jgi:hypothetical protein
VTARFQVEMEMQRMVGIGAGAKHRLERPAGSLAHRVEEFAVLLGRSRADFDLLAVGEREGGDVERVAEGVLGQFPGAVAAKRAAASAIGQLSSVAGPMAMDLPSDFSTIG